MTKTIEAVYESGVLRPVAPIDGLSEHDRVVVTIERTTAGHPLAGWVGGLPDDEAAAILKDVGDEFGRVDPDDWK